MLTLALNVSLSLFLGLLAALLAHPIIRHLLGFHPDWLHTISASFLTALVGGVCFNLTLSGYDPKGGFFLLRVLGSALAASLVAGSVAFRYTVPQESNRHLGWGPSLLLAALIIAPTLFVGTMLHLVST